MEIMESNLHFCDQCLKINKLDDYSHDVVVTKYNVAKQLIEKESIDIPIENLCFAGGGMKIAAYVGGLQVLHGLGLLNNIKRIASSSAGTLLGLLISLKYEFDDIKNMTLKNQNKYIDRSFWSMIDMYSMIKGNYGVHSGNNMLENLKNAINEGFDRKVPDFRKNKAQELKIEKYDPTFEDLYKIFGIELLITVTNITKSTIEYLCPKLTPNMNLCIAARMSMSYPLVYEYVTYNNQIYIDSLCAYPLHVFYDKYEYKNNLIKNVVFYDSSDDNLFDRTVGFTNYHFEVSGNVTIPNNTENYITEFMENNTNNQINGLSNYIISIVKTACNFICNLEMKIIDSDDRENYDKHTIGAILQHVNIFEFYINNDVKKDMCTLYTIKTIEWLEYKIKKHLEQKYRIISL